jgi:stalled ribosome rescue protein Dom34
MAHHFHAVVWIDHSEARIFELGTTGVEHRRIRPTDRRGNIHHKAGTVGPGHAPADTHFFAAIADALESIREILIVGHGHAKTELAHYIRDHVPALAPRIMGVEALDNLTEGEVVAFARNFFDIRDRMTPQR